jgi:hypothetical protein
MYFHFSELLFPEEELFVGAEIEFTVTLDKKNEKQADKTCASRIILLPKGTVSFEVTTTTTKNLSLHFHFHSHLFLKFFFVKNKITKIFILFLLKKISEKVEKGVISVANVLPPKRHNREYDRDYEREKDPIIGMVEISTTTTEEGDQTKEINKIPYRRIDLVDPQIEFHPGDWVQFNVLTHKPTKKTFATNVSLLESKEKREQGVVSFVQANSGYLKSVNRDEEVMFRFNELEDYHEKIEVNLEVEFSVVIDNETGRLKAIKLKSLPKGTVSFEVIYSFFIYFFFFLFF